MNFREPRARKSRGVTLIEMMVGLIIISIGMMVAMPSFKGMSSRNRVATQTNEMILAINLARSEATRRGSSVSIQAQAGSTSDEFGGGWCIVPGNPGDCTANVIRAFPVLTGGTTLNLVADGGATAIRFTALGAVFNDNSLAMDLCTGGVEGRRITISPIGRVKSHRLSDPVEADRPDC